MSQDRSLQGSTRSSTARESETGVSTRPPLHEALRTATATAHHRLENRLPLTSNTLTLERYRLVLEAFYGFYKPLETALDNVAGSIPGIDWPQRHKAYRLLQDLQAIGLTPSAIAALPLCPYVPLVDGQAAALGCLYVVEGATLGGQITSRAVGRQLDLSVTNGAGFLWTYGQATGRMWRRFLDCLQRAQDQPPHFHNRAASAALETFINFGQWLDDQGALS